ncbi:ferrous iron transport protein B [Candidatus Peregrinibacteria bacterium RIFOXYC2_FULL_41_22]|nr:MAG: ferrous iron transport protein B [Candidatus Peregrinibacteria bacterium RIFOXYC2_FULL_41_22]
MQKHSIKIGIVGNPNTGKSTLFNALTGARQHVGNWPGKTIEKKEGVFTHNNHTIKIIDLPGSYSLTAYTEEETITSQFILEERPDAIIQILDAQNLERNLFMTIQLIELGAPLVIAINMLDLAEESGIKIDTKKLSTLLGVPVVRIAAKNKKGIKDLLDTAINHSASSRKTGIKLKYGEDIDRELIKIKDFLKIQKHESPSPEWTAIKLLEQDLRIEQEMVKKPYYFDLKRESDNSIANLEKIFGKDINTILAQTRYGFIKGLAKETIRQEKEESITKSDKADKILTNKFLGLPIFMLIAWIIFQITFKLSKPLSHLIELFIAEISERLTSILASLNASEWLRSMVIDGIIGGVGGMLTFTPIIGILFLIIAILEDSGYMSRVAYLMDKFMHKIGLHGKAFIPMILGFGCNVPGIMATRTLESKRDRLIAILINPFMSCGARLPVYAMFTAAFFSANEGLIVFSLYGLGIVIAILSGLFFKKIFSKKLSTPFVIELPPYRWPAVTGITIHALSKMWIFIKKAGTIILAFSILIWLMANLPQGVEYGSEESIVGILGKAISPIFKPLGFGTWEASVALLFGLVAKEVVVGTFGTLYGIAGTGDTQSLSTILQQNFTPLSAYSFMVFTLLYIPCIATLATIKKETNSWKWMFFSVFYSTLTAWIIAFLIYQTGKLLGFN